MLCSSSTCGISAFNGVSHYFSVGWCCLASTSFGWCCFFSTPLGGAVFAPLSFLLVFASLSLLLLRSSWRFSPCADRAGAFFTGNQHHPKEGEEGGTTNRRRRPSSLIRKGRRVKAAPSKGRRRGHHSTELNEHKFFHFISFHFISFSNRRTTAPLKGGRGKQHAAPPNRAKGMTRQAAPQRRGELSPLPTFRAVVSSLRSGAAVFFLFFLNDEMSYFNLKCRIQNQS